MNIDFYLKKDLLKKEKPDINKARQSIKISYSNLEEAKRAFDVGLYKSTIVFSYMAIFHAGRALLFKDGYREKSHTALLAFLEEKYVLKIGKRLLYEFNTMRLERHDSLYGLGIKFKEKDAEHALDIAGEFLTRIKEILRETEV